MAHVILQIIPHTKTVASPTVYNHENSIQEVSPS